MKTAPGFIVAATHSNSGKTTVTLALMAALQGAGVTVAPFKAGPDYIDPQWHSQLCGRPSYNLDTFMVGEVACRSLLETKRGGGMAVVEGVMGLYDGRSGIGGPGSSAHLAGTLGLPVVLVVDARGMAGSIAPLVAGFTGFAEHFALIGVIANRVGSASHAERLQQALQSRGLPPLLGWMDRSPAVGLAERHLGLVLPQEQATPAREGLTAALHLDIPAFLAGLGAATPTQPVSVVPAMGPPLLEKKRIAVARDRAFCFIYPANRDWLAEMGAEVRFFSPVAGEPLPAGSDGLWLPGGYPELHAESLSRSATWPGIRAAVAAGMPVLAECGGMMALGETLTDHEGSCWPMAGALPLHTYMTRRLVGLGYRQEASGMRGHEFHHSTRGPVDLPAAFRLERGDGGVQYQQTRAAYVHWYFPSQPVVCARWLGAD